MQHDDIKVNDNSIMFVKKTMLFGVIIDDCLTFEDHTTYVCGKVTSKVATLTRNLSIFSVRYLFSLKCSLFHILNIALFYFLIISVLTLIN